MNLTLEPDEDLSVLTADAEDGAHIHHNFKVEYVAGMPGRTWLSTVILRLSDDLTDVGDVLLSLSYKGAASNRVRVAIGHLGGGLPDDAGAAPTPAPPYIIRGQVTEGGKGLGGTVMTLSGSVNDQVTTDSNGFYSFTVNDVGDYTVTPSKASYDFTPASFVFSHLTHSQTGISHTARRQTFTISGQVTDEENMGLDNIAVALVNATNGDTSTLSTSSGGSFSFANIAAGFQYTVTAANNNTFTFTPQSINTLSGNLALSFKGTRRSYTISGQVIDNSNQGLPGVNIDLSGVQTSTDNSGNYSFASVPAGFGYVISAAKTHYSFNPQSLNINNLENSQTLNFKGALVRYELAGRVTDGSGRGLIGMTVTLSGSESATVITDSGGNYSLSATALGNYGLTPSIEQDYYTFAPVSQQLNSLSGNQSANFTATLAPLPQPSYVLDFDGYERTVDYGYYWPYSSVELGHFFWEFWAMPGANAGATYLLSDGYGGAHALLFGFGFYGASEPGRYQLFGDTFDGVLDISHITFFGSDQGPAVGEWGHFAVGWDGQNIITYLNGVPVGKAAFTGPRHTPGAAGGGGKLLIGGSDHNNLVGRIAQVRGHEDSNPRESSAGPGRSGVETSFAPQTVFEVGGSLLSYYFRPAEKVADLSFGYNDRTHVGIPRGTRDGVLYDCGSCPPPQFVIDPSAPGFASGTPPSPVNNPSPAPVPAGARVFDSFGRGNSTYLFGANGGLGLTEGGAAGQPAWITSQNSSQQKPFGILNGVAVLLGNDACLSWVPTGSTTGNLEVRIDRRPGTWGSGISTGLGFRVVNNQNYFFVYANGGSSEHQALTIGYYLDGQRTTLATGLAMPSTWTTLRVITKSSGSVDIYANSALIYSTNSLILATATGAGIYNDRQGSGLVNRWDNFVVYDAPLDP
jgi:protocatechuate 3,4-dioxygenase beta subunit